MRQTRKKTGSKLAAIGKRSSSQPGAPADLLPDERRLWNAITTSRGPDFFNAALLPLLSEYCRLKTQVDTMAEQIEAFDHAWLMLDDGMKRYKDLAGIRDQAQGRMIVLASTMRLTQQSRFAPQSKNVRPFFRRANRQSSLCF